MVNQILKAPDGPPSDVERIKRESNYLRGTLKEVMLDRISSGIPDDDNRLMKHHGSYLQDDRDLRDPRRGGPHGTRRRAHSGQAALQRFHQARLPPSRGRDDEMSDRTDSRL